MLAAAVPLIVYVTASFGTAAAICVWAVLFPETLKGGRA